MALFLFILVAYLLFSSGMPWVEAEYQFDIAKNFVRTGALSSESMVHPVDIQGINKRWYDCHGLTNVIFMIPTAFLGNLTKNPSQNSEMFFSFLVSLQGTIIGAASCVIFFSILCLWNIPLRSSFYGTLCLAFLTIVFPYSTKNYEGNINMLFIIASLYSLFGYKVKKCVLSIVLCGIFAGFAINTRDFSWLYFFCIIISIAWISSNFKKPSIILIFVLSFLPEFLIWGYYNYIRTGFFYLSPIAYWVLKGDLSKFDPTRSIVSGLIGLLFSRGGSIFAYSPILLISVLGYKKFFIDRRHESILVFSIIGIFLIANSKLPEWFGLWCWGPRYTLEITPLLMLGIGSFASQIKFQNVFVRLVLLPSTVIYSLLIQLAGTLTNWHGRLEYLLERTSLHSFFFTIKYSQWLDGLKTLFINFWNIVFGSWKHIENPGYQESLSQTTLYASNTFFTWWNRALYLNINWFFIIFYLIVSFCILTWLFVYIKRFVNKTKKY